LEIAIIGAGVVGRATGKGFARLGHRVTFYDVDESVVEELAGEGCRAYHSENLLGEGVVCDVAFVCVPEHEIEANMGLWSIRGLIVIRSTVPPGTCTKYPHVCHNPEFLREAVAEYEFMNPHKVVIGECCREHGDLLESLYRPFNVSIIRVNPTTSELIKLASNAYLATQISFWNQIKLIADKLGVNSHVVGKACALDPRISDYGASLHGKPYGGKCLPKDLTMLRYVAMKARVCTSLLDAVSDINETMRCLQ
jgi:UDPglucose 6-dehydrogenase